MKPIIIIGTGLAGYQLAREFRKLDQTTPLILITMDDGRFYSKPLLSTALTNKKDHTALTMGTAESMGQQLNATIRTHQQVTAINTQDESVVCGNEEIHYSKLVLACGAHVIKPALTGDAAEEVVSINHLHDYATFQDLLRDKKHVTILGAGLIGCEFANDLSNADYNVNVVTLGQTPLEGLIPNKIGALLQQSLEENGVKFHFGTTVKSVNKTTTGYLLSLSDDETIESELVLSAVGLRPHIHLAKNASIQVNRGIMVNRYLETNIKNIYALGDCAEVEGHVLPYIAPLLNATRALSKTLQGERTAVDYPAMPVIVKTPSHPIAVCPPPKDIQGEWKIEMEDNNVRALFYNAENQLYGFVLTNNAVKDRMSLAKEIPGLF